MEKMREIQWSRYIVPAVLSIVFYAFTANVRSTISDELKGYVNEKDFQEYRQAHAELMEAKIDGIRQEIKNTRDITQDIKQEVKSTNELLKRALSKQN